MRKQNYHKISFTPLSFDGPLARATVNFRCARFILRLEKENTDGVFQKCRLKAKKLNSIITSISTARKESEFSKLHITQKRIEFFNILNYLSGVADAVVLPIKTSE